jgi:hypothetical protein
MAMSYMVSIIPAGLMAVERCLLLDLALCLEVPAALATVSAMAPATARRAGPRGPAGASAGGATALMTLSLRASVAMRVARGWAALMRVSLTEAVLGGSGGSLQGQSAAVSAQSGVAVTSVHVTVTVHGLVLEAWHATTFTGTAACLLPTASYS